MHLIKRPDSSSFWFKLRTPANVSNQLQGKKVLLHLSHGTDVPLTKVVTIGQFITFSVETEDDHMAGIRERNATGHLEKLFKVTAAAPKPISHHDLVALSKTAHDLYIEVHYQEPGTNSRWAAHKALSRAAMEGRIADPPPAIPGHERDDERLARELFGDDLTAGINAMQEGKHSEALERRFGIVADWVLIHFDLPLSPDDRERFLKQVALASIQSNWTLKRAADGDYSPDPKLNRFPAIEAVKAIQTKVTIQDIFDGWWAEAKATGRKERTRQVYKFALDRLTEHLGHDDANRVTPDDMIAFKAKRLEKVSAKTFRDADMPGIKSVFDWAHKNRKIKTNPAAGITIKPQRKDVTRAKGFVDAEAKAIFANCLAYSQKPKETEKVAAAKRWAPLIAAYTGSRISEVLQLRKQDVFEEAGHHVFRITPEAGDVKTGQFRLVPVHSHLIDLGLLTFVDASADGPLFAKSGYDRVREFVRSVVTDPNVDPNHGWRHRFKTIGRNLGLDARVVDAIQGHAGRTAGDHYGDVTVIAMSRVIAAIPRIEPAAL
jgi:integrase